ncbi:hypothetical protein Taro_004515 [Colocasia esculenta]|uniref:At3g05675-like ankyrin-like domain-containing protein n=1 Tax=Colocasia esculenta TaxID=4460 RepID=A0A843TRY2_COLES|nr:hypothetical protein [Colocasia esculenta]
MAVHFCNRFAPSHAREYSPQEPGGSFFRLWGSHGYTPKIVRITAHSAAINRTDRRGERGTAMAGRGLQLTTPEYVSVMRPSHLLNSLLVSSTNVAAKMLVAVASSSTVATRDGERWKAMDHLRYLTMITLWLTIWMLRILTDFFPTFGVFPSFRVDAPHGLLLGEASGGFSPAQARALVLRGGASGSSGAGTSTTRAVGRALCHVLSLLSDIPVTSRKYDFVLSAAERILDENEADGDASLQEINRQALSSTFGRTCDRLRRSLQASHESDRAFATWPARVLQLLPLGSLLASYYQSLLCLLPAAEVGRGEGQQRLLPAGTGGDAGPARRRDCVEAEKLAQELLWTANKMRTCGALDEAVVWWSFATDLASLSLTAHPRVQGPIVKISVLLLRALARREAEAPREVRFRTLALWLPLLCYAGNGTSCPVLTAPEKRDMEGVLEELIEGLPWEDQELILSNWMEDFALSMFDWPNLQSCYDQWCRSSRKLLL